MTTITRSTRDLKWNHHPIARTSHRDLVADRDHLGDALVSQSKRPSKWGVAKQSFLTQTLRQMISQKVEGAPAKWSFAPNDSCVEVTPGHRKRAHERITPRTKHGNTLFTP